MLLVKLVVPICGNRFLTQNQQIREQLLRMRALKEFYSGSTIPMAL